MRQKDPLRRLACFGFFVLGLLAVTGCSSGGKSSITGKVTYQGKVLTTGSVFMVGPDGAAGSSAIDGTGTYTITGLTPGLTKIAVVNPNPNEASKGARPGVNRGEMGKAPKTDAPSGWFAIPAHFGDPATSTLSSTFKSGSNQYDIELK